MEMDLVLNFEKTFISQSVGIFFQENLQHRDVVTLNRILQGKKALYQDANSLICSVLKALVNANKREETEFVTTGGEDQEGELSQEASSRDLTQSESLGQLGQSQVSQGQIDVGVPSTSSNVSGRENSNTGSKVPNHTNLNKKKELCRFYARGRCNRARDCRFGHPNVCKKFRLYGSRSTNSKGCDGKCNALHPNACRSSLLNKTCSFSECRFFHLKGTRLTNSGHFESGGQVRRSNNQCSDQVRGVSKPDNPHRNSQPNQPRPVTESKNWRRHSPDQSPYLQSGNASQEDPVKKDEEKIQLNQTLEAIMRRLSAMEARQTVYLHPAMNQHPSAQPVQSPAVPLPGSQTQHQWGSPNQWPQSQF